MSTPVNAPLDPPPRAFAPPDTAATRPMYWSIRRELWENRSITIAPLAVAALVLFGFLISTIGLPRKMRSLPTLDPARQHVAVVRPFSMAPAPIMLTTFLVGLFYSLDALYGERRDRSILFWKSLPVSDLTTVLSKASIPLVVLPLIGLALGLVAQYVLLLASTAVLVGNGMSPARLWAEFRFFQDPLVTLYGLTVHVLWFAPIYGWLLLVSAWARRAPVLWAVLPPFGVGVLEKMARNTSHFASLLKYRVTGAMTQAFDPVPQDGSGPTFDRVTELDPARFLSTPGLWIGLAFAAASLAVAVRLRRSREPT